MYLLDGTKTFVPYARNRTKWIQMPKYPPYPTENPSVYLGGVVMDTLTTGTANLRFLVEMVIRYTIRNIFPTTLRCITV